MYPFTRHTDYLPVLSQRTHEDQGYNYINIRNEWHNTNDIVKEDVFVNPSWSTITGQWFMDGGDPSAPVAVRESRIYCRSGKATITFTGTCILLRIYVNPLYGSADIRIDSVLPSTLANVVDPVDILSFNSYDHVDETWGQEYLDISLASNITNAEHTVEIYCENDDVGVGGWCPISGYKVAEFSNKERDVDGWVMTDRGDANKEVQTIANNTTEYSNSIADIELIFDPFFLKADGTQLGTITEEVLWGDQSVSIDFWPGLSGTESEGVISKTVQLTASYEDIDGVIEKDWGGFFIMADREINDPSYSTWGSWYCTEEFDIVHLWSTSAGASIEIDFFGTWVEVYFPQACQSEYGAGLHLYIDDVYVKSVSCWCSYWDWFRLESSTLSGLGNTAHTIRIVAKQSGAYNMWHAISWEEIRTYTEVVETITYNYDLSFVPPFPPENPRFLTYGDKSPTCDPVNSALFDPNIPRDNTDVTGLWLEKRPATFAVCYQAGFEDILKTYDIVIVEPKALTRTIVKNYQDSGLKVFCYCSYGEEVGSYENEWDISSATVPLTGDGNGVGGYASYYNKGENQFGECSECKHDRRRLEGVTECALEQTAYYAVWAGRCSNACTKDWRTGYETYILGWNCGGGYNSSNNWSRTATKACTNSDCPQYNAVKGACPYYEPPDENMYGQDYSIFTSNWPDENGIWKSFYTNPREQSWNDRLREHYLSVMFDEGIEYAETVKVNTYPTTSSSVTVDGFKVSNIPIDSDEDIIVTHIAEDFTYVRGQDYLFDLDLGTFKMQVSSDGAPPAPWGTMLSVTYTRKGLQADGVFIDTIDTVDVYTSDAYRDAMVAMINEHHALYPDKLWAMNRGFSILGRLMPFTDFVMFESFVTTINWDTGDYYEITDPAAMAANQVFIDLLFRLREIYTFNVLGLNYCDNDDDDLKQTIAEKVREYGWLSWNSTISLNDPQENTEIFTKDLYIESNAWRLTNELDLP